MTNKRALPDKDKQSKRIMYMKEMKNLAAIKPLNLEEPSGMEDGNGKTGSSGSVYDRIFIWNLPPVITCPGISKWCTHNCYNADDRYEKYPIGKWCENLWWIINCKEKLKQKIISQLGEFKSKKVAVRIHSSGDFFSLEYIDFWKDIIQLTPDVHYWAYTRSWAVENLVEGLKKLGGLPNVKLILSWDQTMKQPIEGFPKSIVVNSNEEIAAIAAKKGGVVCPEQYNLVSGCADCGICINKLSENIYFLLH